MQKRLQLFGAVAGFSASIALAACSGSTTALTPQPTPLASASPTPRVSASPTPLVSASPTALVSASPTALVSASPTALASASPTASPTAVASILPTTTPSPSASPSAALTNVSSASGECETSGTPSTSNGVSCTISGTYFTYSSEFQSTLGLNNSNSASGNPTLGSDYYLGNPGTFAVSGTAFGGAKTIFTDTPSPLSGQMFYETFTLSEDSASPSFQPNTPFTCTAFDNGVLLGSASAVSGGGPSNGLTVAAATCYIAYPQFTVSSTAAMIVLPSATVNPGDTYTFVLSH